MAGPTQTPSLAGTASDGRPSSLEGPSLAGPSLEDTVERHAGLTVATLFSAGVWAGGMLPSAFPSLLAALGAAGAFTTGWRLRGTAGDARSWNIARVLPFFLVGLSRAPAGNLALPLDGIESRPITIIGTVHEPPVEVVRDERGVREVRTLFTLEAAGGIPVRVACRGSVTGISGGRRAAASGTLVPALGPRNPGDRPPGNGRFLEVPHPWNIRPAGTRIEPSFAGLAGALRGRILSILSELYPEGTRGFIVSMILGDRRLLPSEVREALLLTGTFHLLAISGLHVVLVMALVLRVPLPRPARAPGRLAFLGVFVLLTGASPPVLRAALMFAIHIVLERLGRRPRSLNTLGWTALALLALDPGLIHDVGFQLSFISVAAILTWGARLSPRGMRTAPPHRRPRPRKRGPLARIATLAGRAARPAGRALLASLAISAGASAGTAPITLLHFQRIHPLGPLWNLLGYPLTVVPVAGGFASLALGAISLSAGRPVAWAVDRLSEALLLPLVLGARLPGSAIFLPSPAPAAVAVSYGILWAGLAPRLRRPLIGASLAALALLSARALLIPREPELWTFDAGAGDAALLSVPAGAILIDGGARGSGRSAGENLTRAVLAAGHRSLLATIVTHAHADHLRGLEGAWQRLSPGSLWVPPAFGEAPAGTACLHRARKLGIPVAEVARGLSFALQDPGIAIDVLHPTLGETLAVGRSPNDASLALRVTISGRRILFLGDLEEDGLSRLLASGEDLHADVVVAPHHGRANVLWPVLLDTTRPRTVIISGSGHGGGREVAAWLEARGIRVLATWRGGSVRTFRDAEGDLVSAYARGEGEIR